MLSEGALLAGRYRLRRVLGEGGSAAAWEALDELEGQPVALKLLREEAGHGAALRAEFARLRELSHPHLTRVRDYGRAWTGRERVSFYTSELIHGRTLRAEVARVGLGRCERALRDAFEALSFLHRIGLRHGDVKPENVLVDGAGRGVLIDLGCTLPVGSRVLLGGTPGYFAPELTRGEVADQRADLYAVGVMLAELGAEGPLRALSERLRRADPAARPSSLAAALVECGIDWALESAPLGRVSPLCGRAAELAQASAALSRAARGAEGPRIVWVEGARGLGSTRFLRELAFGADPSFEVFEGTAQGESARGLIGRALGPAAPGVEALVTRVAQHSLGGRPSLLLVHDVDRATPEHVLELALALGATAARGTLAWVVSSTRPPPAELVGANLLHLALGPLSSDELARWAGVLLSRTEVEALHRHTGGYPLQVERVLSALARGALPADALERPADAHATSQQLAAQLADLSERERRALACAALGLASEREPSARLFERGLLQRDGADVRLARDGDVAPLLELLPAALVRELSREAAVALEGDASDAGRARRIAHLARAGDTQAALTLLRDSLPAARRAPRLFVRELRELTPHMGGAELVLTASLLRSSGEPRRALSLLSRARRRAGAAVLDALSLEAAECYLALGSLRRAERTLRRVRAPDAAECAECLARIQVRLGSFAAARDLGSAALERAHDPALRARLHEGLALALSYLGQHDQAEAQIAAAEQAEPEPPPRVEARRHALRGFLAVQRGDSGRALPAYERALASADTHGLADLVANALLNLANAQYTLGSYGTARDLYERALRMAHALGRRQSELFIRANLANVALELGAFEEAARILDALAAAPQTPPLSSAVRRYRAELALWTGTPELALSSLAPGAVDGSEGGEQYEEILLRFEAELALGRREARDTAALLANAAELEPSLAVRQALAEARLALLEADQRRALERCERALALARDSGQTPLLARSEAALADVYAATGSPHLEREQRARAQARWERMSLDLPPAARDAFFRHPLRRAPAPTPEPRAQSQQSLTFVRVVELSRRINAQRTSDDVLRFALDAALELTSAERGFVLVHEPERDGFEVKSQRQLDPRALDQGGGAFSRGIAERVIQTGEAVITLDAAHDPRFQAQASVHAMGLKSVLCVPFRSARGLSGALYLDNRLLRSRFTEADAALVQAFAEQVAVALGNAQLLAELEQKQRELARKQRKVEELLRGKERELQLLSAALAEERAAQGTRFAYRELVGNSAGLRRLFATLDRVVPTDLPVIVRGESGTGKELVARAIHAQGPRAKAPFVALNCAALPENLLESELFGYVKGAFTGADRDKPGLFVAAHGGTLFLDELAELPLGLQVKLLRVLTERELRPLGATRSVPIDVRIVAATHRDLERMRQEGSFREDLYYRLSVVEISLPPLRERRDDIVPIAERLLTRRAEEQGTEPKRLSPEAVHELLRYPFPGNVRELENVLLRASALCDGGVIGASDLGLASAQPTPRKRAPRSRSEFERDEAALLLASLERERWNLSAVSRRLGIPRNTLYRKLARLGLREEKP